MKIAHRTARSRPSPTGVTLVELLVAIVIISILAAVAFPAYTEYMQRSRRADAVTALGSLLQAQERYRSNRQSYAESLDQLNISKDVSPNGHYTLGIADVTAATFTLVATPVSSSPQAKDKSCASMRVLQRNGTLRYAASSVTGTDTSNQCWPQ